MKLVSRKILLGLILLLSFACSRDMVSEVESECEEEVSYNDQIRSILDISCAYSGCHVGGSAPGNFSSYSGISSYIDSELIERRALIDRNMPPSYAVIGPTSLTEEEIELFQCWVQSDYPEN